MNTLGIALWGIGNHAQNRILPILSSSKEISLIGVCSRDKKKVLVSALKWNCLGWTDFNEMLSNSDVDIIYLASPIGVHFDMATKALKAGKHVWCEKPLTCNLQNTKKLIQLARKSKKILTETFMYLHHSQFNKIENLVTDKKFGQVCSIICRFGIPNITNPGFRNDPNLCGGAFWDVGSYPVSAILALFPDEKVKVLFSEICKKENSPVDTEGRAVLRFSKGTSAYLEWGTGVAYKNEIELWLEEGSFFTDKIFSKPENYQPIYHTRDVKGNESINYGNVSDQFMEMMSNFSTMLQSSSDVELEYKSILARAELMDEIVKSSKLENK